MKVLVTGANGFLGTALLERLLHHGETDVRCAVRPGRDTTELRKIAARHPAARVEMAVGDLRSPTFAARAVGGVGVIYHLAAGMRGSWADLCQNTVVSSRNLLDGLVSTGSGRVVLVSSFAVYGSSELPSGTVINEMTPLERHPERRDAYAFSKIRQERLFWEYRQQHDFSLIVARPGVVYGPGGAPLSTRVGIQMFGVFFNFGQNNALPLTYVDNCAEGIVVAGRQKDGDVFNIVDDDVPTAREFLRLYRRHVGKVWYLPMPYFVTMALSKMVERYHNHSKGQLPAVLTPYKSANLWKGHTFDNSKLKSVGWRPIVTAADGMQKFLAYWREADRGD